MRMFAAVGLEVWYRQESFSGAACLPTDRSCHPTKRLPSQTTRGSWYHRVVIQGALFAQLPRF
jgi:hypothetical protein